jgi:hypothetical protein
MRRILLLSAVLALASLTGCVYDYAPPPPYHETTYSYVAPSYYPPPGAAVVVYHDDYGWQDDGWHNYGRDKSWDW